MVSEQADFRFGLTLKGQASPALYDSLLGLAATFPALCLDALPSAPYRPQVDDIFLLHNKKAKPLSAFVATPGHNLRRSSATDMSASSSRAPTVVVHDVRHKLAPNVKRVTTLRYGQNGQPLYAVSHYVAAAGESKYDFSSQSVDIEREAVDAIHKLQTQFSSGQGDQGRSCATMLGMILESFGQNDMPGNLPDSLAVEYREMSPDRGRKANFVEIHYPSERVGDVVWKAVTERRFCEGYLSPLVNLPTTKYAGNIQVNVGALVVDGVVLPVTVNEPGVDNSYVVSPFAHYFTYGIKELSKLPKVLELAFWLLTLPVLSFAKWVLFDKVILVNNWMLSTNLYPAIRNESLEALGGTVSKLSKEFHDRAVIYRSVDAYWNKPLQEALKKAGCRLCLSRIVHYQDMRDGRAVLNSRNLRNDIRFLESNVEYYPEVIATTDGLKESEMDRLLDLYRMLYIDKYTDLNPQITEDFIRLVVDQKLWRLVVFREKKTTNINAFCTMWDRNGVMTVPFLGYDTGMPQSVGLYRMVAAYVSRDGQRRNLVVNWSAGVSSFKQSRAGRPVVEYNAVYDRHLPFYRRIPWMIIEFVGNYIAVPMILYFEL